jgi:hypothetical protein
MTKVVGVFVRFRAPLQPTFASLPSLDKIGRYLLHLVFIPASFTFTIREILREVNLSREFGFVFPRQLLHSAALVLRFFSRSQSTLLSLLGTFI